MDNDFVIDCVRVGNILEVISSILPFRMRDGTWRLRSDLAARLFIQIPVLGGMVGRTLFAGAIWKMDARDWDIWSKGPMICEEAKWRVVVRNED